MGKTKKKGYQLAMNLPVIDMEETRKRVENELETVRIYRKIGFEPRENKVTPSYEVRYHGSTGAINKPAEDTAIWNVMKEQELKEKSDHIDWALNRLSRKEREIITRRYLDTEEDEVFDMLLCGELGMSDRTYRRIKAAAFYQLSIKLRMAVYVWPEPEEEKKEKNVTAI